MNTDGWSNSDDWNAMWSEQSDVPLSPAQNFRQSLIIQEIQNYAPKTLLDVGFGLGFLLQEVAIRYPEMSLFGIEQSSVGLREAKEKVPSARLWNLDINSNPASWPSEVRDLRLDLVVASEVAEHLDYPEVALANLRSLIKPGGLILVTVPGGPITKFDRVIGHRQHFDRTSVEKLLVKAGFKIETVEAAGFPFHNLYKLMVLLRGVKLTGDLSAFGTNQNRAGRIFLAVFSLLFKFNRKQGSHGWQIIAVARNS